jgi:hypothetical protein
MIAAMAGQAEMVSGQLLPSLPVVYTLKRPLYAAPSRYGLIVSPPFTLSFTHVCSTGSFFFSESSATQ